MISNSSNFSILLRRGQWNVALDVVTKFSLGLRSMLQSVITCLTSLSHNVLPESLQDWAATQDEVRVVGSPEGFHAYLNNEFILVSRLSK